MTIDHFSPLDWTQNLFHRLWVQLSEVMSFVYNYPWLCLLKENKELTELRLLIHWCLLYLLQSIELPVKWVWKEYPPTNMDSQHNKPKREPYQLGKMPTTVCHFLCCKLDLVTFLFHFFRWKKSIQLAPESKCTN